MNTDQSRISAKGGAPRGADEPERASQSPLSWINRRRFLAFTSGCFFGLARSGSRAVAGAFKPIDIGPLQDFAGDGISEKFIQNNFFVTRNKGRLFAVIATCPHKGNYLLRDPKNAGRIICSGHDSVFTPEGVPVSGRVRQPLAHFGIALNPQGRVLVNPDQQFAQKQWNDKGSFIAVK